MESDGLKIEKIRTTGGQTQSDIFNQIKADVLGKEIELPGISESELLGAAIYAISNDTGDEIDETANRLVSIKKTYKPDLNIHKIYSDQFKIYRQLYERNKDMFIDLLK
jgi:xylulokinase